MRRGTQAATTLVSEPTSAASSAIARVCIGRLILQPRNKFRTMLLIRIPADAHRTAHRRWRLPRSECGDPRCRAQGGSTPTAISWSAFATAGAGVLEDSFDPLTIDSTRGILPRGGTILGSSRTNPYKREDGVRLVSETIRRHGLDGLIAIGGEDTLGAAKRLHAEG